MKNFQLGERKFKYREIYFLNVKYIDLGSPVFVYLRLYGY